MKGEAKKKAATTGRTEAGKNREAGATPTSPSAATIRENDRRTSVASPREHLRASIQRLDAARREAFEEQNRLLELYMDGVRSGKYKQFVAHVPHTVAAWEKIGEYDLVKSIEYLSTFPVSFDDAVSKKAYELVLSLYDEKIQSIDAASATIERALIGLVKGDHLLPPEMFYGNIIQATEIFYPGITALEVHLQYFVHEGIEDIELRLLYDQVIDELGPLPRFTEKRPSPGLLRKIHKWANPQKAVVDHAVITRWVEDHGGRPVVLVDKDNNNEYSEFRSISSIPSS
jgi:hypothetical protein